MIDDKILSAIQASGPEGLTYKEASEFIGEPHLGVVSSTLSVLLRDGLVGTYGERAGCTVFVTPDHATGNTGKGRWGEDGEPWKAHAETAKLSDTHLAICGLLSQNKRGLTESHITDKLGMNRGTTIPRLNELCTQGHIKVAGKGLSRKGATANLYVLAYGA
jgi:DNA-binding Lrp family transcriptional regulator